MRSKDWVLAGWLGAQRRVDRWEPGGYGLRTLFDNFIGRKRDVDGGVLAGSRRKLGAGRDKLTVTFQTTIPVEPGFSERREMDGKLRGSSGLCLELVKWGREAPRELKDS